MSGFCEDNSCVPKDKFAFCTNCMADVQYYVRYTPVEITVNGVPFQYDEAVAVCRRCGNEIYINWINDWNVAERSIAYYKAKAVRERR